MTFKQRPSVNNDHYFLAKSRVVVHKCSYYCKLRQLLVETVLSNTLAIVHRVYFVAIEIDLKTVDLKLNLFEPLKQEME